jgi:hypothetical protein
MSSALRRSVPLKAMCSSTCATPLIAAGSCRVPTLTQTPIDTVSTDSMRSVTTRMPLASLVTCTLMMPRSPSFC